MTQVRKSLDRIATDIKQSGKNIDTEINELAECAVSVAGRITLKHDGMRQPYFAGIMVRDSEMAAVTMGSGCAYLYRGDVLYPLTADDFPMEAIDYAGKAVTGLDVYCAGVAGTVRYSNIAQLQLDDCLVVCNKEIMESLGQREVLRMLYEAEDQADAAGMVITAASAKLPGAPMQFMIGFVESISSSDRTGRMGFTRNQSDLAATVNSTAASSAIGHSSSDTTAAPAPKNRYQAPQPAASAPAPVPQYDDLEGEPTAVPDRPSAPGRQQPIPVVSTRSSAAQNYRDDYDDESGFGDEIDVSGRGRRIAFYIIIAAICVGCLFLIYNMLFGGGKKPTTTSGNPTVTVTSPSGTNTASTGETTSSENGSTETGTAGTTAAPTTAAPTGVAPTTNQPGTTYEVLAQHTVAANDSLWAIAMKYYNHGEQEYIDLIKAANNMQSDIIKVGQVLIIPVKK